MGTLPGPSVLWSFPNEPGSAPAAFSMCNTFIPPGGNPNKVRREGWKKVQWLPSMKLNGHEKAPFIKKNLLWAKYPFSVKSHLFPWVYGMLESIPAVTNNIHSHLRLSRGGNPRWGEHADSWLSWQNLTVFLWGGYANHIGRSECL